MCYRLVVLFFLLLLAASGVQGATLRGVILANGLEGPPIANVDVSAVAGANPTLSDSHGRFMLEFPRKEPGEMVLLIITKKGSEVVNSFQLKQALPRDADAEPLTLLLATEQDREEMARCFYRLKSLESIEKTYQQRLKELEARSQATAAALAHLRQERDQAKTSAEKAVEEIARLKPEPTSELYQQAMSMFIQGDVDAALKLLDEERLHRSILAARRRREEAEQEIDQAVQGYQLRAQLLYMRFRFDEAEKTYQAAVAEAPESFAAQFALGSFCRQMNRLTKALGPMEQALAIARRAGAQDQIAKALSGLGILHVNLNRMDEARKAFEEALSIRRDLARQSPEAYLPEVAWILNNLGNLHRQQNRQDEARKAYEEALKIRRDFAQQRPESFRSDMAMILNNLGVLDHDQNRMGDAAKATEESLKIYRDLALQDPEDNRYVARSLGNLGTFYKALNRMDEARKVYEEAIEIQRGLARHNPESYRPEVASTLNDLGILHRTQNRLDEAGKAIGEALEIRRGLARENPETYLPDVAETLNDLGILHRVQKGLDESGKDFAEALKIRRDFARQNPETYRPLVAMTLSELGILHHDQNRLDEARQAWQEALDIYQELAQHSPAQFADDVTRVKDLLAHP